MCLFTFALLGPSTDRDSKGTSAPLVEIVKLHGSPHFPADRPGPYAVRLPLVRESTWNLYGEPDEIQTTNLIIEIEQIINW